MLLTEYRPFSVDKQLVEASIKVEFIQEKFQKEK